MEPIDISKIANKKLQVAAKASDVNNRNGMIDEDEISIFTENANIVADASCMDEFMRLTGLELTIDTPDTTVGTPAANNKAQIQNQEEADTQDVQKDGDSQNTGSTDTDAGLSHKSEDELKEVKLINKLSLYDVLSEDFLNEEYTKDDEKLKTHMKESGLIYDEMSEEEIQKTVESEKAKRQARFNEDGTYNLEELEDAVYTAVGTDGKLNQSKDTERTESLNATRELNRLLFGNKSIDTYLEETKGFRAKKADRKEAKVVKKVVEYVGGEVEKNERKTITAVKNVANTLPILFATAIAPYELTNTNVKNIFNINTNLSNVWCGFTDNPDAQTLIGEYILRDFKRGIDVNTKEYFEKLMEEIYGSCPEDLYQQVQIDFDHLDGRWKNCINNLVNGLGVSIAMAVLQDLIIGQERPFEKTALDLDNVPIAKVDADGNVMKGPSNDIELFKNYVTNPVNNFPANTNTAIALAEKFTFTYTDCDGKEQKVFDFDDFKYCFEELAGKGSNMNAEELLNIGNAHGTKVVNKYLQLMNDKKQIIENQCCGKTEQNSLVEKNDGETEIKDGEVNSEVPNPPEADTKSTLFVAHRVIETVDARKSSWSRLTQCYECLNDVKTLSDRIRILKLAQGVTDGDYSKERMDKLLELNKKYGNGDTFANACKKEGIEFDTDAFKSALNGTCLGKVTLPRNFYDCERTNDENLAITVTNKGNGPGVAYNAKDRDQYRENVNGAKKIISKDKYDQHKTNGAPDENW